jgi:hypothetical protein
MKIFLIKYTIHFCAERLIYINVYALGLESQALGLASSSLGLDVTGLVNITAKPYICFATSAVMKLYL